MMERVLDALWLVTVHIDSCSHEDRWQYQLIMAPFHLHHTNSQTVRNRYYHVAPLSDITKGEFRHPASSPASPAWCKEDSFQILKQSG